MALAETAKLVVDLSLKGNFARQLATSGRALGKFDARLDQTESRAYRAGQQIGTGIKRAAAIGAVGVGILAVQVEQGLQSLVELEKQTTQTNAVIKSTGGVAGITATQVRALAEEFESMNATVGDEVIQNAENLLLTFTNVRQKAFKPTLQAALDMNTALGGGPDGLAGIVRLLGRALDDPEKGLALLERRTGKFTKAEKAAIAQHLKNNDLLGAQAIILGKLNTKYGGSFLAQGGTTAGKVAKFHDAIEDLQRTLAAGLLPVVSNIADALTELFADPAVQQGVKEFGENLAKVLSPANIKSGIGVIKDVLSTIGAVAGPAATAIGAIVTAFTKMPDWAQKVLIGGFALNKLTGGLVTNVAGGLAGAIGGALKTIVAGNVTVIGKSVVGPGGLPGGLPGKGGGSGILGKVGALGLAGVIIAAAVPIGKAFAAALPASLKGPAGHTGQSEAQRRILDARAQQNQRGGPADHFGAAEQQKKLTAIALEVQRKGEQTAGKLDANKTAVDATRDKVSTTGSAIQNTTRSSSLTNAAIISSSVAASTGAIVGAIFAARPIVNVTAITKTTTVNNRYGSGNGSQGQPAHDII